MESEDKLGISSDLIVLGCETDNVLLWVPLLAHLLLTFLLAITKLCFLKESTNSYVLSIR